MEDLKNKLQEIEAQLESLSLQREKVVNEINVQKSLDKVGDIFHKLYKVPNGDGSVFLVHTSVNDICNTTEGEMVNYNCIEIRLDLSNTVHISACEKCYKNADDFGKYNVIVHSDEIMGIEKLYKVLKGINLIDSYYNLA